MAIEGITFTDSDKNIEVIIDGKTEYINVQSINKLDSTITINRLNNTALKDDIVVDATLSPVQQGVLTISVWSLDKTIQYYSGNASSTDGNFLHKIPNNLNVGKYIVTLEYAGNKYYKPTDISKQIEIKRREIFCSLDSKIFYVQPDSTFTKTFKLVDKLNNQPITDCEISYLYKDETFNINSDSNGNISIEIPIPDTNKDHCTSNKLIYPVIFYLNESESYSLRDTTIKLIVDKINTQVSADQIKDDYGQYVHGHILFDKGYANYGNVEVSILENYKQNVEVDSSGYFITELIDIDDVIALLSSDSDGQFTVPTNIPTLLTIEVQNDEISIGENISATAIVKDNRGNIVVDGAVNFEVTDDNNKLIYHYATELNDSGQASFALNKFKKGRYHIKAKYESIITYKTSESGEKIVTVGE